MYVIYLRSKYFGVSFHFMIDVLNSIVASYTEEFNLVSSKLKSIMLQNFYSFWQFFFITYYSQIILEICTKT